MADYPALPFWTDKYLADTRHLNATQHGAYLLLLMEAWRRPTCSLPDDPRLLARLACCSDEEWAEIGPVVMAFWRFDGRRKEWTQKALSKEREFLVSQSRSQRDRAAKRWNTTKKTHAGSMPDASPADAPTPTPTQEDNSLRSLSAASPKRTKGTRLPNDWSLPTEWGKWAQDELKAEPRFIRQQGAAFRDYWCAKPTNATKLDWEATWRNWMRKAVTQTGPRGSPQLNRPPTMLELNSQLLAEMENADARRQTDNGQLEPPAGNLPTLWER